MIVIALAFAVIAAQLPDAVVAFQFIEAPKW